MFKARDLPGPRGAMRSSGQSPCWSLRGSSGPDPPPLNGHLPGVPGTLLTLTPTQASPVHASQKAAPHAVAGERPPEEKPRKCTGDHLTLGLFRLVVHTQGCLLGAGVGKERSKRHVHTHAHSHTYTHTHRHTCTCSHTHTVTRTQTHVQTHPSAHADTRRHTHAHTDTLSHTPRGDDGCRACVSMGRNVCAPAAWPCAAPRRAGTCRRVTRPLLDGCMRPCTAGSVTLLYKPSACHR